MMEDHTVVGRDRQSYGVMACYQDQKLSRDLECP